MLPFALCCNTYIMYIPQGNIYVLFPLQLEMWLLQTQCQGQQLSKHIHHILTLSGPI
jgi:hypothetical protein